MSMSHMQQYTRNVMLWIVNMLMFVASLLNAFTLCVLNWSHACQWPWLYQSTPSQAVAVWLHVRRPGACLVSIQCLSSCSSRCSQDFPVVGFGKNQKGDFKLIVVTEGAANSWNNAIINCTVYGWYKRWARVWRVGVVELIHLLIVIQVMHKCSCNTLCMLLLTLPIYSDEYPTCVLSTYCNTYISFLDKIRSLDRTRPKLFQIELSRSHPDV